MIRKSKIVVAMSGGVDSSVAACLLHEQGHEVVGFFMRTGVEHDRPPDTNDRHQGCCSASDAADARYVAGKLGINFYALNMQKDFDSIIDYFTSEYKNGRTPNPCVVCNDRLKFGKIVDYAKSIDADWIATGHYARIDHSAGRPVLRRGIDRRKDQSYVLFGLQRDVLDRIVFPLGEMTKEQVREEARRFDLPVCDKPDSVEICFVPDRDYARVVRERDPETIAPGDVVAPDGKVVGQHEGIANFTIGQRRGLGIAFGMPIYVTALDPARQTVTVGPREDLLKRGLVADRVNWLTDPPTDPFRVLGQIRYQHQAAPATAERLEDGCIRVVFDEPQSAITPGQAVVLYDGEDCLGGGWIQQAFDPEHD